MASRKTAAADKISFGLPWLDEALAEGLYSDSLTYLFGHPGSGRGALACHFLLEGILEGHRGFWLSIQGTPPVLPDPLVHQWETALSTGMIERREIILHSDPPERILERIKSSVRVKSFGRVVIQNIDLLSAIPDPGFLLQLVHHLRSQRIPVLLTGTLSSYGGQVALAPPFLAGMVDCILVTRTLLDADSPVRTLSVLKTRSPAFVQTSINYSIGEDGIIPTAETALVEGPGSIPSSQPPQKPHRFVVMPEIFYLNAEEERMVRHRVAEVNLSLSGARFDLPRTRFSNSIEYNNQFEEFKRGQEKWDFFIVDVYRLRECIERDLIYPLDEFMTEEWREQYLPIALNQCSLDGRIWALPHWINVGVLACRNDLLARYHLQPPRTWEDLVEYSRYILEQEKDDSLHGFGFQGAQFEALTCNFLEFLWNSGGNIYDASQRVQVNSDRAVRALTFMCDLIHRWKVSPPQTADLTEAQTLRLFLKNQLIFARSWPDLMSRYSSFGMAARDNARLAPLPTAENSLSPRAVIGGFCYVIPRYVKNPEALVRFYQEFYSPSTIVEFAVKGWTCPPFKSIYENPDVLRSRPFYRNLPELFRTGRSRTHILYYDPITRLVRREVNFALRREKTPHEALDAVADELHKTIHRTLHERRLSEALDFIRQNLQRDLNRKDVAVHCHLSPSYFSSVFKQVVGCSFTEYLTQRRIEKAQSLLASSDLTIAQVAEQSGFSDQSYFCRVFRDVVHMTPSQYRLDALSKLGHH